MLLNNFNHMNIAIIGATGGIGSAIIEVMEKQKNVNHIYTFSKQSQKYKNSKLSNHYINIEDEYSIEKAACSINTKLDLLIIATGILSDRDIAPEKSLRDISYSNFSKILSVNTIGPAIILKYFSPLLNRDKKSVIAAISARIGSISDNKLGGWYSYRASKTALNMVIKNASIELARKYKNTIIVGLHPGTVDTKLSRPFQNNVKNLFTPKYSAKQLLKVINNLDSVDSGKVFAWDGTNIPY